PMLLGAAWDRIVYPARGAEGGADGAPGRVSLASGALLKGKGRQAIPPGEHLVVETPGGGGLGDARERSAQAIAQDVRSGLVSAQAASRDYHHGD
ncbi:hydantoinase B/oxoprolinase family protein, partial [Candidatus Symbiopectobacterium sp. NZEC135]